MKSFKKLGIKEFGSLITAASIVFTMSGCSLNKNDNLLEGTVLDDTKIITMSGKTAVFEKVYCDGVDCGNGFGHDHYIEFYSRYEMTNSEKCDDESVFKTDELNIHNLYSWLTEAQLIELYSGSFDNDDALDVISAVYDSNKAKSLTLG